MENTEPESADEDEPEPVEDVPDTSERSQELLEALAHLFFETDSEDIVVAADGSGDCVNLASAITGAPDGATLTVKPGTYVGPLRIDKDLTIVGEGEVRVRPELPAETAERLDAELTAANEALTTYAEWALPEIALRQFERNVTFNPVKRVKMKLLNGHLESDERAAEWAEAAEALVTLDRALWDRFVVVEDARVTFKNIRFGLEDSEARAFTGRKALKVVPKEMRRDMEKTDTLHGDKGAPGPWVGMKTMVAWAEEHGYDEEDLYGTEEQFRDRERHGALAAGSRDHENPLLQWGWWHQVGGMTPDVTARVPGGIPRLKALRDGARADFDAPMLSFHGSDACHGLILEDCAVMAGGLFSEGITAISTHPGCTLSLTNTAVTGVFSRHEAVASKIWDHQNAPLHVRWAPADNTHPVSLKNSTFSGGFVGLDIQSGGVCVEGCTITDNAAIGGRVFGRESAPDQTYASFRGCTVQRQGLAGLLGFRLSEDKVNYDVSECTFGDNGAWKTGSTKSKAMRDAAKRHAEAEKQREAEEARRKEAAQKRKAAEAKAAAQRKAAAKAQQAKADAVKEAKAKAKRTGNPVAHPHFPHVVIKKSGSYYPADGYSWATKKAGDFRVVKKAPPEPTGKKLRRRVSSCNVKCETAGCKGPIKTLHYFNGRYYPDGEDRGYFCSAACIQQAEDWSLNGMPHRDVKRGEILAVMDDFDHYGVSLVHEPSDTDKDFPPHTRVKVISDPYWITDDWAIGGSDGASTITDYIAVTVEHDGIPYTKSYTGWFYFTTKRR